MARSPQFGRLAAGSAVTLAALGFLAAPAHASCTTDPLLGQICTTVDSVVAPITDVVNQTTTPTTTAPTTPTTLAPAPAPVDTVVDTVTQVVTSVAPVPAPSTSPTTVPAPAPSVTPSPQTTGAAAPSSPAARTGAAPSPASTTAGPVPTSDGPSFSGDVARGFDLPAVAAPTSNFVLSPAPVPTATNGGTAELASASPGTLGGGDGPSLPRSTLPITVAVLLVAGVLGAHGVRWVDKTATATATTPHS